MKILAQILRFQRIAKEEVSIQEPCSWDDQDCHANLQKTHTSAVSF